MIHRSPQKGTESKNKDQLQSAEYKDKVLVSAMKRIPSRALRDKGQRIQACLETQI